MYAMLITAAPAETNKKSDSTQIYRHFCDHFHNPRRLIKYGHRRQLRKPNLFQSLRLFGKPHRLLRWTVPYGTVAPGNFTVDLRRTPPGVVRLFELNIAREYPRRQFRRERATRAVAGTHNTESITSSFSYLDGVKLNFKIISPETGISSTVAGRNVQLRAASSAAWINKA